MLTVTEWQADQVMALATHNIKCQPETHQPVQLIVRVCSRKQTNKPVPRHSCFPVPQMHTISVVARISFGTIPTASLRSQGCGSHLHRWCAPRCAARYRDTRAHTHRLVKVGRPVRQAARIAHTLSSVTCRVIVPKFAHTLRTAVVARSADADIVQMRNFAAMDEIFKLYSICTAITSLSFMYSECLDEWFDVLLDSG
jgi:hypothetical protein